MQKTSDFYEDRPGEMSFIPEFKPEKVGNCETGTNGNLNSMHKDSDDEYDYIIDSGIVPDNIDDMTTKKKVMEMACNMVYKPVLNKPNYQFKQVDDKKEYERIVAQDSRRPPLEHPKLNPTNVLDKLTLDWFSSDYEEKRTECFFKKEREKKERIRKMEYEAAKALPMSGMVIFKINVGHLPKDAAEEYIDKYKETIKHVLDRVPANYETVFVPTRTEENSVQVVKL